MCTLLRALVVLFKFNSIFRLHEHSHIVICPRVRTFASAERQREKESTRKKRPYDNIRVGGKFISFLENRMY